MDFSFSSYLQETLRTISRRDMDDAILACSCKGLENLVDRADELLKLADQQLHVFPFKEVKPCWFRLFTDASIVKAIKIMEKEIASHETCLNPCAAWIDEVVGTLDMAILMAGALGREEMIHELLTRLQGYVHGANDGRPSKRRKSNPSTNTGSDSDLLFTQAISVPKLKHPVRTLTSPSLECFSRWLGKERQPVLLHNTLDHWPAVERWKSSAYWRENTFDGRRLVPVEIGRSYVDDEWGQKIMPFQHFLVHYILSSDSKAPGYLAQHDLFRQLPALSADIATPDYCYLDAPNPEADTPLAVKGQASSPSTRKIGSITPNHRHEDSAEDQEVQRNIWFGPAWTITPLHHDPYHNILCQVVGTKYIRLFSPHESHRLRPMSKTTPAPHQPDDQTGQTIDMSNTSSIDFAAMELSPDEDWEDTYPGIGEVPYLECLLSAGEALYIPVGWWHYVRSCSVGISVSYWW